MKTVIKVFLWIQLISAILALLFMGLAFLIVLAALAQATEPEAIAVAIMFGIMAFVIIPAIVYASGTLKVLEKAKSKSDISTARKVCGFIFGGVIVGVLLCVIDDDEFAPPTPPAPPVDKLELLMKHKKMLDVQNLLKVFHPNTVNQKVALNGVSLHLDEGDFVTVIGGNGAGKSTLLNCIAGVFGIEGGSILIDGVDVTKMPEHKRAKFVSRVFQDPMKGTAASMNLEDNLALASQRGKIHGLKWNVSKKDKAHFAKLVESLGLGLESRMGTKVALLSGGQRQALTLLMATMNKPKLLLLDEHTAALDPKTAEKVLSLTRDITAQNNQTTVMITHNMKDAIEMGNKLIMMSEGRIIYTASGEEKRNLTVDDLLAKFREIGQQNDRILLS